MKLFVLAIILTMCGCVSSPAPDPDTGFYESSFGDGSSIKTSKVVRIGSANFGIVEVINNNKRTTLLRCSNYDGITMTVLNSEELQPEKSRPWEIERENYGKKSK